MSRSLWIILAAMFWVTSCGESLDAPTQASNNAQTQLEQNSLASWYEEERLAHDVYGVLGAQWGAQTFTNIQRAEATHMERVDALLQARGMENPAKEVSVGQLPTPTFAQLYEALIARGERSLPEALKVGLYIEEKDIEDLELMLEETSEQDIRQTLNSQLNASTQHLKAFAKALEAQGESPQAQLLSTARFEQLLASSSYVPQDQP